MADFPADIFTETEDVDPDTLAAAYHDQVGYWLWEPATGLIVQSLTIPRGQTALAAGQSTPDAKSFKVSARRGDPSYGICSTVFLEHAFRTESYDLEVSVHTNGSWSYFEDTVLLVKGEAVPFHHETATS